MKPNAILVDFGGVLTTSVRSCYENFCRVEGIDIETFRDLLRDAYKGAGTDHPLVSVELGLISQAAFETALATRLSQGLDRQIDPTDLTTRIFGSAALEPDMVEVLTRLRRAGVRCAMLSNSLGDTDYPAEVLELFDETVISGLVGMRKPDPAIFHLALQRLGSRAQSTIFVDDARPNVRVAQSLGIQSILHTNASETVQQLEQLFEL